MFLKFKLFTKGRPSLPIILGSAPFSNSSNTISGLSATVNDVTHPDVINRLGEVLYVQTIKPITRLPDQTEDFKIVLDF